jgi:hypothetical protein
MDIPGFPEDAARTIAASNVAEFATLTAAGVPLDTPLLSFVSDDRATVAVATGLAYPVKAERARRRPTVGLCFGGVGDSGAPGDDPVVAMAAVATVRDSDPQANTERYIRLTGPVAGALAAGRPWSEVRGAIWYWCRIWIECTPVRVLIWRDGLDRPAHVWEPDPPLVAPASDPAPASPSTKSPQWGGGGWRDLAEQAVRDLPLPYLTALDQHGAPLPFPVRGVEVTDEGLALEVPAGAPWDPSGPASVCFAGRATFIGRLDGPRLVVERQLPLLPLVEDPAQIFAPDDAVKEALMGRLDAELERRGQARPVTPTDPPPGFQM